jgi:hypothetical protein
MHVDLVNKMNPILEWFKSRCRYVSSFTVPQDGRKKVKDKKKESTAAREPIRKGVDRVRESCKSTRGETKNTQSAVSRTVRRRRDAPFPPS